MADTRVYVILIFICSLNSLPHKLLLSGYNRKEIKKNSKKELIL